MSHRLPPLSEEPINEDGRRAAQMTAATWRHWLRNLFHCHVKRSDLRILLSVVGCPLFPVPHLHPKRPLSQFSPQVSSSAEYIIHHFTAATGCRKLEGMVKNMYATGRVSMAMVDHHDDECLSSNVGFTQLAMGTGSGQSGTTAHASAGMAWQEGCFVIWQMVPDKWLIELVVEGHKVVAGCDGNVAWRHTPWLGAHAAKGGVRPLRRVLQGLDPIAISWVFSTAQYIGEKHVLGMDCFVLKLSAEHADLVERSDISAEMIKHITLGYFSQRSGLLVYLEDSYLTRIQAGPGSCPTYWETSMRTKVEDYRPVVESAGVMIAHSGHSSVTITRFGEELRSGAHGVTRMEETYAIDDLALNVPGLSADSFIPPQEIMHMDYHPEQSSVGWITSPLHHHN